VAGSIGVSGPVVTRIVPVCDRYELRRTLGPLRQGASDPTVRHARDGSVWRATRTPSGPATGRYRPLGTAVEVSVWGPGGAWLVEHAADLLGLHDDVDGWPALAAGHPVLRRLARDHQGFRLGRSLAVFEALVPTILAQKVTGREARRSWSRISRRWGEVAPGPVPLRLPPAAEVLANVGYHELHPFGVERRRADTIRAVARHAHRLEEIVGLPRAAAEQRLRAIPGVGAWTAAEVALIALGDSDAVSIGDYHIPTVVCFALTGERDGTDERMLELLAPFAPHRGRAIRLLETAGLGPERRGPRLVPMDFRSR
jgi:3-methyladenine DNA glycosylase/8-oxoguanine DNA glycosylase